VGVLKTWAIDDAGFTAFLREVLDTGELHPTAEGITKLVINQGEDALSSKQKEVFERYVLDQFVTDECERCGSNIPWSEMMPAHETGQLRVV
jgi:hypothetical protein